MSENRYCVVASLLLASLSVCLVMRGNAVANESLNVVMSTTVVEAPRARSCCQYARV